jgi:hypothetical protein
MSVVVSAPEREHFVTLKKTRQHGYSLPVFQQNMPIGISQAGANLLANTCRIGAIIALVSLVVTGCTTPNPVVYEGLASAAELRPNTVDRSGREPFHYQGNADWSQYDKIIVDPVTVYKGRDNQFGKVPDKDRSELAGYMQATFTGRLRGRFAMVAAPGPQTLRLRLTLTGAKTTTPVLGPFSHLDVGGGVYNGVQAVRGREGAMTGSVTYAVEVYDAASDRLLLAYVAKQYPNAMNVGATFGALKASMVGIDKAADELAQKLR